MPLWLASLKIRILQSFIFFPSFGLIFYSKIGEVFACDFYLAIKNCKNREEGKKNPQKTATLSSVLLSTRKPALKCFRCTYADIADKPLYQQAVQPQLIFLQGGKKKKKVWCSFTQMKKEVSFDTAAFFELLVKQCNWFFCEMFFNIKRKDWKLK